MSAFIALTPLTSSAFTHSAAAKCTQLPASPHVPTENTLRVSMSTSTSLYRYSPTVDEYFAKSVTKQYIAKACPSGVPPIQCIEGNTFDAPYESRTLKRQSQLRYRQLPTNTKLRYTYEARKYAVISCNNCSHEESQVVPNPMLANAMNIGKAESDRACSRYILSSGPAEDMMYRETENMYMKAVNGSGVFTSACTDGQAKYEAYLAQVRGKAVQFRAKQYSVQAKAAAVFAARQRAKSRKPVTSFEEKIYGGYPKVAGHVGPEYGYFAPFVTSPSDRKIPNTPGAMIDSGRAASLYKLSMMSSAKVTP